MKQHKKLLIINACIVLGVLLVSLLWDTTFQKLERGLLDQMTLVRGQQPVDPNIAIVAIDEKSLNHIGPWPWSRDYQALLIEKLNQAGAKIIGFDIYFQSRSKNDPDLDSADRKLLDAVKQAGNVILPEYYHLVDPNRPVSAEIDASPIPSAIKTIENKNLLDDYVSVKAEKRLSSFANLIQVTDGSGHINRLVEKDGQIHHELMVLEYGHQYIPSLALKMAQKYLGLENSQVALVGGEGIRLGDRLVQNESPIAYNPPVLGLAYINFRGGEGLYPTYSFVDVTSDRFPIDAFKQKIVLVGATAPGLYDNTANLFTAALPGIEKHAQVIDNILHNDFFRTPLYLQSIIAVLFFLLACAWAFAAPFLRYQLCILIGVGFSLIVLCGAYLALVKGCIWIRPVPILLNLWLILGVTLIYRQLSVKIRHKQVVQTNYEALKELGMTYQAKGELEKAYHTFNQLPLNDEIRELLFHLAKQLEKTRKDSLANQIFDMIAPSEPELKRSKMTKKELLKQRPISEMYARANTTVKINPDQNLQPGNIIGRYEIIDFIGEGAMGEVYLAQDPHMDREVAVKTYRFKKYLKEEEITSFQDNLIKEAKMAGKLNHPNIVTFYDAGKDWDLTYVVMELLKDGTDLSHYIQNENRLPYDRIFDIVVAIASGLSCIHENHIIHRDIKPSNIMVLTNGVVKIMDFGVAFDQLQTDEVILAGTPIYMPPEQLAGLPIDARSDLYALGQVWFELLTGKQAHSAQTMDELIKIKESGEIPSVTSFRSDIPAEFQNFLNRLLAPNPQERYPSGQALINDLNQYRKGTI